MDTILYVAAAVISCTFLYYYHLHETTLKVAKGLLYEGPLGELVSAISPQDKAPMVALSICAAITTLVFSAPHSVEVLFTVFLLAAMVGTAFYPKFLEGHYRGRIRSHLAKRLGESIKGDNPEMMSFTQNLIKDIDLTGQGKL